VRKTEADCFCADLREAYQRLRAGTSNDANEHLRLAQWCLRQGLLDVAAQEVDTAATLNPQHPMIEPLRRRLEMSNQRPQASAGPARSGNPYTLAEELDRMLRTLPPGSIEYFTQRVQPVLMNNCTTSNCHGQQSETAFRLFRIPSDRPASRRLTQRNLYTALQWIDRENPAASKLLTVPLAPHGTAKTPMFADATRRPGIQRGHPRSRALILSGDAGPCGVARPPRPQETRPVQGTCPWRSGGQWSAGCRRQGIGRATGGSAVCGFHGGCQGSRYDAPSQGSARRFR
jgi:hypothetical protein